MLFGDKTTSMFDVWSIQHLLFAVSLTTFSKKIIGSKSTTTRILILSTLLAYSWEAGEWCMETGLGSQNIQFWFQGHEYWANRFIADSLLLVVGGYFLVTRVPGILWPARVANAVWITFHIAVFPHCMYLQEVRAWTDWRTWVFVTAWVGLPTAVGLTLRKKKE